MADWPVGYMRAVMFFRSPESQGFSEEYLAQESDIPDYQTWAAGLLAARINVLPEAYTLEYVRLNRPHDKRTVLPYTGTPQLPATGNFAPSVAAARVECGALVKMYTLSGRYAMRIFRGIDEAAIDNNGDINTGSDWYTALEIFLNYLKTGDRCGLINVKPTAMHTAFTYEDYNSWGLRRSTTRDTGRFFGQRRGRSVA